MAEHMNNRPDVAYYYPAPYWGWQQSGWVKSLLLFFDQIAILLPSYMYGRHQAADPELVEPLEDLGLLQVLEPNDWVDKEMANQLAEVVVELLTNGTFDDLPEADHFQELSQSRIGYSADINLAEFLVDELQDRGLARPSTDGVSIPLHPTVRTTILVVLGQLSRIAGVKRGINIHPATNDPAAVTDLVKTLSREPMPSYGKVITLDLEPVSFDMDPVPLDDLLQFRADHQNTHRAYMRTLQHFMAELASIDASDEREALLLKRRQEVADAAHDLQRSTHRTLRKNLTSWSLGLTGSAWSFSTGDPIGFALAAAGLVAGSIGNSKDNSKKVTAYSYLFEAHQAFQG